MHVEECNVNSLYYLSRYTHIEGECPFVDFKDLLQRLEDLVCEVVDTVMTGPFKDLLKDLNPVCIIEKN